MARASTSTGDWEGFQKNPLPGVHVEHLARCLAPIQVENEALLRRAFALEPFRSSLIDLLRQALDLKPLAGLKPASEEAGLAALDVAGWERTADLCGLMLWSPVLARELRGAVLRPLETRFGASWWRWVELGQTLAREAAPAAHARGEPDSVQEWVSQIREAGFAVLDAWTSLLDEDLAAWARLKRPPNPVTAGSDNIWHIDQKSAVALVEALTRNLRESP